MRSGVELLPRPFRLPSGPATPRIGTRSCLPGMLMVSDVPDLRMSTTFGSAPAENAKWNPCSGELIPTFPS